MEQWTRCSAPGRTPSTAPATCAIWRALASDCAAWSPTTRAQVNEATERDLYDALTKEFALEWP
ncbi:hypothetical protein IL992_44040 [Microbispora sp. NEAU-D428]|uniref:hypothetical protein n=1 Tax=Microbispora sitophila TaxID=2771537 RepID=UPI001867877D|nr:hypothetical protein [Microbispora sitophila]MBE3016072.1 hypothetical protein [Microbispora sitophila]